MTIHKLNPHIVDPTGQRSFPNIAIETKMLIDHFKGCSEGASFSYAELARLIGRACDPTGSGYHYLASAKRILLRDFDMLIDAEPKSGVRVCTNEEKLIIAARDMKRSHRAVRRARQKLHSVQYERLNPERKREWNARASLVGALELMGTSRALQKVERLVEKNQLPSADTLALFSK